MLRAIASGISHLLVGWLLFNVNVNVNVNTNFYSALVASESGALR